MSALAVKQKGLTIFLHFYTKDTCMIKNLVFYQGERRRIVMPADTLKTAFPMVIILEKEERLWKLNEKQVREDHFCILNTKAEEEVMVVISRRKENLAPCEKLRLWEGSEIKVGKDFWNEIFYDCFSFVRDFHMRICKTKENTILEICSEGEGSKAAYVYVNGITSSGRIVLNPGDVIEMLGLILVYLPGIIICISHFGSLRLSQRREEFPFLMTGQMEEALMKRRKIEQGAILEKKLLTEEIELRLPEKEKFRNDQPLFLTIGPSVTMVLPMLLMAFLGSAVLGQNGAGYYKAAVAMTAASAFLSVFWGSINHYYKKRVSHKEEQYRKEAYRKYLEQTEQYIAECFKYNQQVLNEKYPPGEWFFASALTAGQVFWNRSIRQKDYLFVRLGLGDIPFQVKIRLQGEGKIPVRDLLTQKACDIAEKYQFLTSVPVGIDLSRWDVVGFTGDMIYPVFLQALLELAACHDGKNMKFIYFYHEEEEVEKKIAECIKWLPHTWKAGRKLRYMAGNEAEAGEILPELVQELENGQDRSEKPQTVYLFLLAASEFVKGEGIYRTLMAPDGRKGIVTLVLDKEKEKLPGECRCMVVREKDRAEIVYCDDGILEKQKVIFEESTFLDTEKYMRQLSEYSFKEIRTEEFLDKVSFLELFSCEKVEELNCQGRWSGNRADSRIRVPIGIGAGRRIIYLDVHEKFHGPHGLIAGTTGAGKSELLQTYLLSLAVSFGPEDINFFIIDYKGGGMGNTLWELPHCAGVISNLSGRQIRRALLSIKSENERRQRLLGMAGVNHVADYTELYREGKAEEPMPHLLLVVDEFAELKKEEPEFMQEIISVAQVGRSLGVHLLLATQKPAGTVDDKIWSNTRFRLCLRVADKQDSMDMLHRADAAYLTGAGQCYLQVGNNELYELFQAGYGGAEYEAKRHKKEVCMISGTGKRFYHSVKKKQKPLTQTEAVIDYINEIAVLAGSGTAKKLWMPELPDKLVLEDRGRKEEDKKAGEIGLCMGICDDPGRQRQYPLYYHPLKEGHLCICGAPAAGKSTLLQTLLWQLCRYPGKQVQFMLAGSDNAGVNCFEDMPGCLGRMKKKEDAECFFFHVERLLTERKEKLSGINFLQYRRHKKDAGAFLFLIIDNYGSFRQLTEDRYGLLIEKIAAEGLNYGFYLIITALNVGTGEMPGKLFEKMKVTVSLEMSDRFQYGDVLRQYHINVWPKENVKGRGLCKADERILEFQVPLFSSQEDDYDRIRKIEELSGEIMKKMPSCEGIEKFPCILDKPEFGPMFTKFFQKNSGRSSIPLGYEEKSGYIADLPIEEGFPFLISGGEGTGKGNLLCCLLRGLWEQGMKTVLFDRGLRYSGIVKEAVTLAGKEEFLYVISSETEFIKWYCHRMENKNSCLCLCDMTDFSDMLCEKKEEIINIREEMKQMAEGGGMLPMIVLSRPGREMEAAGMPVYEALSRHQYGIHLGGNAANQRLLSFDDLSYVQMNQWENPGIGYLKRGNGSGTERIRLPFYNMGKISKGEKRNDISGCTGPGNKQDL